LIIWDETPTQHRHYAKVIDRILCDIMQRPGSPFSSKLVVFGGDLQQCSLVVSTSSRATFVFVTFSRSVLWREVCVLILTENMRLRTNPFFRPYVEYLLRVGNGQEYSIIDHFPPEANLVPPVKVEIVLYLEIHQVPSLNTLIHIVFPALVINMQTKDTWTVELF
jgi:hypothetical protein